jgi:hypothetical protein
VDAGSAEGIVVHAAGVTVELLVFASELIERLTSGFLLARRLALPWPPQGDAWEGLHAQAA